VFKGEGFVSLVTLLFASVLVVVISFVRRRGSWSAQRLGPQGR
jgi:hypothetical protein